MHDVDTLPERFWSKVQRAPSGCWIWLGWKNSDGYGRFWLNGRDRPAHRVSFEAHIRALAPGEEIDHLCHVRACVNPMHLRAASHRINQQNRRGAQVNSKSGVRGVIWNRGRWQVIARHKGRQHYGGRYLDLAEAEAAAVALRAKLHHPTERKPA